MARYTRLGGRGGWGYGGFGRFGRRLGREFPSTAGAEVLEGGGYEYDGQMMFWMVDRPWKFTPQVCQLMVDAVLEAMAKALSSGVVEYRVGSRSLRRFTLKELQDLLGFWMAQYEDSLMGGRARRGAPTDT